MLGVRIDNGGVPAMMYGPEGADGLLLLGHGGGYGKDSDRVVRLCRSYAEQTGLAVVCIDAVDHGERRPAGAAAGLPAGWHSTTIARMVGEWQQTVDRLAAIGPAVAFVGFSMGMIFGVPTVASMPSIRAAVFGVGGLPSGPWINDPSLESTLLTAAAGLGGPQVLMLNMTQDRLFRTEDTHRFFDAIPGTRKRLMFWEGEHDDWPGEAIGHSIDFINEHAR